ncbi:MAG TPA: class F sortase [Candidatus Saccharimonadales bacterium]|jgi:LPXTG-site transpeptidase (sortase) family protein
MNRRRYVLAGSVLLIIMLAGGATVFIHSRYIYVHAPQPAASVTKNVVTKTLASPSKVRLTASNYTSTAAPNEPGYISLPSINSGGYVQKVGVDQYDQMAAPNNVHLAGWYVNSLLPGQAGLSVIDGHVDGYYHNQGIFGRLNELKLGDVFTVTFGNGGKKSFVVKSSQLVDANDVPGVLFAHDPTIPNQLNLITCGGDYNGVSHTYDKRTIVVSSLVTSGY